MCDIHNTGRKKHTQKVKIKNKTTSFQWLKLQRKTINRPNHSWYKAKRARKQTIREIIARIRLG